MKDSSRLRRTYTRKQRVNKQINGKEVIVVSGNKFLKMMITKNEKGFYMRDTLHEIKYIVTEKSVKEEGRLMNFDFTVIFFLLH